MRRATRSAKQLCQSTFTVARADLLRWVANVPCHTHKQPCALLCSVADLCALPLQTELHFNDVKDLSLRALLEGDRLRLGLAPGQQRKRKSKQSFEFHFTFEERLALEVYWKLYAQADMAVRADMEVS